MKNKTEDNNNIFSRISRRLANTKIGRRVEKLRLYIFGLIENSIRFELIAVFGVCFAIALAVYSFTNSALTEYNYMSHIEYDYGGVKRDAQNILDKLTGENDSYKQEESTSKHTMSEAELSKLSKDRVNEILIQKDVTARAYITDLDGKVLFSAGGEAAEKVDIYSVLEKMNTPIENSDEGKEITYLYPLNIDGQRSYFLYTDRPEPSIRQEGYYNENPFLALIISVITFLAIFIIVTNKKMKYIEEISKGLATISKGDLTYRIDVRGKDEIAALANNINYMAMEVHDKIQAERLAEQTKGELITNVSHDLRTPLTSVMGYLGLVKEGKYEDEAKMNEYLNIAFSKAERLKLLIDDLFEYTKLSNSGIKLEKNVVNLNEFLSQLIEEYIPVFEENEMHVHKTLRSTNNYVEIDSGKIVRVYENLLSNAIKYSYKPGVVMIDTYNEGEYIVTAIKNRGESISKEKVDKLFDRFYRVDEARNSDVSGTGLGLAISKNIVELHDGSIWADSVGQDITFYVKLRVKS